MAVLPQLLHTRLSKKQDQVLFFLHVIACTDGFMCKRCKVVTPTLVVLSRRVLGKVCSDYWSDSVQ